MRKLEDSMKLKSLESSIKYFEEKMNDPKIYVGWKDRHYKRLNELKKEYRELKEKMNLNWIDEVDVRSSLYEGEDIR